MYVCMYEICIYIHISIISAAVNYRAWQICGVFFFSKINQSNRSGKFQSAANDVTISSL